MVEEIINMLKASKFTKNDLYTIHRHIGNMIKRRMYYTLRIKTPQNTFIYESTDRFEEVLSELSYFIVQTIKENGIVGPFSEEIFFLNPKTRIPEHVHTSCDEEDMWNIFRIYLTQCSYEIEPFEVLFHHADV